MATRVSSFLWGLNYENVTSFGYPLFSIVTDRVPRAGSEWRQGVSGVEDSWLLGFDYQLSCEARWLPLTPNFYGAAAPNPLQSAVGGADSVQAFLDWARAKNTFRFVPDIATPLFYVDGCYLADPLSGGRDITAQLDFAQQLVIRNPAVDLLLALRGLLFEFAAGAELSSLGLNAECVRAQAANYTTQALGLQSMAANLPRAAYSFLGARALVVEQTNAKANVTLWSETIDITNWPSGAGGTFDVSYGTADGLVSPFVLGDLSLTLIKDADGNQRRIHQAIPINTLSANGITGGGLFLKKGTAASTEISLFDETASLQRMAGTITWNANGSVTSFVVGTGTSLGFYHVGGGVYCFLFQTTSALLKANVNAWYIYPAGSTAANTGSVYVGGPWLADAAYPGSYRKTTSAIATRTGDAFRFRVPQEWSPRMPQAMYIKFINHGQLLIGNFQTFLGLAWAAPEMGQWSFNCDSSVPRKFSASLGGHGGTTPESYAQNATAADGDTVELLLRVVLDTGHQGHIVVHQSVGGAAETTATAGTIILPAKWDRPLDVVVGVQDVVGATAIQFLALQAFKWVAGASFDTIAKVRAA